MWKAEEFFWDFQEAICANSSVAIIDKNEFVKDNLEE